MAHIPDHDYDPTEFRSADDYARARASAEQDFGKPRTPHTGAIGEKINRLHAAAEGSSSHEGGWGNQVPARESSAAKWSED